MFENPRRGRQARNFATNVPKILVLKSSSEQIFSRKLPLGAPVLLRIVPYASGPLWMESWNVTIQMKATERYFPLVLFVTLYFGSNLS